MVGRVRGRQWMDGALRTAHALNRQNDGPVVLGFSAPHDVWVALVVLSADQITKQIVLRYLQYSEQHVILDGFFKFVHWGNTGAAWSMFYGNNRLLALGSRWRPCGTLFDTPSFRYSYPIGQAALGLMLGYLEI